MRNCKTCIHYHCSTIQNASPAFMKAYESFCGCPLPPRARHEIERDASVLLADWRGLVTTGGYAIDHSDYANDCDCYVARGEE